MKPAFIYLICTLFLILAISLAITLISNQQNSQQNIKAQAIYITDGDTFQTETGEIIRLLCVDTPEKTQGGYEEATAYLSSLILGKDIIIERKGGLDKYNRTLAWVYLDSVLINKEIVDNGFGSLYEYPENSTKCAEKFSG